MVGGNEQRKLQGSYTQAGRDKNKTPHLSWQHHDCFFREELLDKISVTVKIELGCIDANLQRKERGK